MTDQSAFSQNQEIIQPPPEVMFADQLPKKARPGKKAVLIGILVLFGLISLGLMGAAIGRLKPPAPVAVTPTPTPVPVQAPFPMQIELARLKTIVEQADPNYAPFPPPKIDMDVEF